MEPTDLNSPDDNQLERWLRSTHEPAIADDGFTSRVMARLPAPESASQRRSTRTRFAAMIVGAGAGVALVCLRGISATDVNETTVRIGQQLTNPAVCFGLAVAVTSLTLVYLLPLRRS